MKEVSAGLKFNPRLKIQAQFELSGLEFSAWPNGLKKPNNHNFQPGLRHEFGRVPQLCFQISHPILNIIPGLKL